MKKIETFIVYIILGAILLFVLKGCISTTASFDNYILAEQTNENGHIDRVILTPQNEMLYLKRFKDIDEIGLYKLTGEEATHYIAGLYCFGSFPFGLRYYNNAENVVDSEMKLVYKVGDSFPEVGESFKVKIVIFNDHVIIGKDSYKRIKITEQDKEKIKLMVEKLKEKIS